MRLFMFVFLASICTIGNGQLSGELFNTGRGYNKDFQFKIEGHKVGYFVFDIGVDMDGNIKVCQHSPTESSIVSTPLMVKAKNHILMNLKFEKGYHFPELHSGKVKIEVILSSTNP